MIRVFFLIRSLEIGGAERQLVGLLRGIDKERFEATVATFYPGGALRPALEDVAGVRVLSLEKRGRWDIAGFCARLARAVRESNPDILHGYMGIANELCLAMGARHRRRVVYGLRAADVDYFRYGWLQGWGFRAGAVLSRYPDCIIVNSRAGQQHCVRNGYDGSRMVVIPNGIDTELFRPDAAARGRVRAEWRIREEEPIVGLVARLDPIKDHSTFLRAAVRVLSSMPRARFVCVGDGPAAYHEQLRSLESSLGLEGRVLWAGARSDMPAVFNAFDVACCCSLSEGHPNVVGEAMACAVPCVVTDVGDAAWIVGDTGVVVPAADPEALGRELSRLLRDPNRRDAGTAARSRIEREFSMDVLIRTTERVLSAVGEGRQLPCA